MKSLSTLALFVLLSGAAACQAQQQQQPQRTEVKTAAASAASQAAGGWRPLFNGRDTNGWEHLGPGGFVLENNLLRTDGGMGLLWYTRERFGDCVIRVVYKTTEEAANAGVFVRVDEKPKDEWYAVHHGYEIQILDAQDEYHRTGAVYSIGKATARASKPIGEWNTMEITLRGPRIVVNLNGVEINNFDPATNVAPPRTKDWEPERGPRAEVGYIGLQNHDDYQQGSHVYFKEVSVKKL